MDQTLKDSKLGGLGKGSNSASRYKTQEQTELAFTPKPFISSRAMKNSVKEEALVKRPEGMVMRNERKVSGAGRSVKNEGEGGREYGATMPPEFLKGQGSGEKWREVDGKGVDEVGDQCERKVEEEEEREEEREGEEREGEEQGMGKEDTKVEETENVDIRESTHRYPLHTYQPRLAQASFKYNQQRKLEKSAIESQPLFSSILSAEDMDRIKKVKEFVKSKDSPQQKTISIEMMPFKDDPIKNKRCYNFFCEMEGLEIGGVSAARLMTASEIRNERKEFTDFYQQWKTLLTPPSPDPDPNPAQTHNSHPRAPTHPDLTLPTKRPAPQILSHHPKKPTPHHHKHN